MRKFSLALLGVGMIVFVTGLAFAVPIPADNIFTGANGTTTYPGTYVGEVGGYGSGLVNQIGTGYYNTGNTKINGSTTPVIYSFYYAGGQLSIGEWVGNNGVFTASTNWNAALVTLPSADSTTPGSLIALLDVPFSSGPSFAGWLIQDMDLDAGYYAIKNWVGSDYGDPQFQINFASIPSVPEPATMLLLGLGLVGLAGIGKKLRM